jgi:ABC-type nitrate/sulfonate/bicarbonate transport system substrate-binding protein
MASLISRRDALAVLGSSLVVLSTPVARAAEKVRVGKAVAQVFSFIPLNIGMKYGFFEKEGLEIEAINFVSGAGLAQALTAGAIDITLSAGPDMAFTAKGAPEIAVASITSSPAFMGIAIGIQSTARSLDDLKGKKIAVTSAGSLTYWLVDELNRVKGWTKEEDRAIPIAIGGAPPTQFAAIKTGQVDASIGGLQVGYQLEEENAGRLLVDLTAYVKDIELFVIFASTSIVQQNPDGVRRFLRAWFRAVDFMKSHKAETVQLSIETAGYSPTVANRMYDRLMSQLSSNGKFEPKALEKLRASFIDLKILDSSVDMSRLYTTEFLPKI